MAFLGWAYELKTVADYGAEQPVSPAAAARAIDEAGKLIEAVASMIDAGSP